MIRTCLNAIAMGVTAIRIAFAVLALLFGGAVALGAGVMGIAYLIQPTVRVYIDNEEVYVGNESLVNVDSAGPLTYVRIKKNLGLVTDKIYLSSNVRVEMVEENK